MPKHKIAVISDTHGILLPKAVETLRSAELILHGGDIADQGTWDKLKECSRVIAVRGNCDKEWAKELPKEISFELYGKKIYMIHNKKQLTAEAEDADIVIYGHSHKYEEREEEGRLWLNPGSGGPRRFGRPATMAVLEFDDTSGRLMVERIDLSDDARSAASDNLCPDSDCLCPELDSGELWKIVETIVRDIKRRRSVDYIVRTRGISRALTEQICQIYFTHPGIDVRGVVDRMEVLKKWNTDKIH